MKPLLVILFISAPLFAQHFQMNDPNPSSSTVVSEVNFQVDKYYPIFGTSEKPYENERIIRLTDLDGKYTAYMHFNDKYSPPRIQVREKILHYYYPEEYYDYIINRISKETAYIVYREYKDGHKWGEIYFDKYP